MLVKVKDEVLISLTKQAQTFSTTAFSGFRDWHKGRDKVLTREDGRYFQLYAGLGVLVRDMYLYLKEHPSEPSGLFKMIVSPIIEEDQKKYPSTTLFQTREDLPEGYAATAADGKPTLSGLDDWHIVHEWTTKPGKKVSESFFDEIQPQYLELICGPDGLLEQYRQKKVDENQFSVSCAEVFQKNFPEGTLWIPLIALFSALFINRRLYETLCDEQNIQKERYTDFHLHISSNGEMLARSNQGERAATISVDVTRDVSPSMSLIEKNQADENLLEEFGKKLYESVFPDAINTHFSETEAVARDKKQNVRIRLTIDSDELAQIPWEFIYRQYGGYYLSVNPKTAFTRYLDLPLPANRVISRVDPLDLLLIIASPKDQGQLDPDEWEKIVRKALKEPYDKGDLTIRVVKQATRQEISSALLQKSPDIVQFVGHGIYKNGRGYLALVDGKTGNTWELNDAQFANIFLGAGSHLGLVSLATCESAKSASLREFIGIAPQIVQRGVPAVVAMQYSVLVSTAEIFLEEFYKAIAFRKPVDWAVQWARNQISLESGLDNREFATPVLYMRAEDGNIF